MKSRLFMIIVGLVGLQCAAAFACHGPTTSEQKCFSKCKLTGESDESCRAYCHKNFPENATSVLAGGCFPITCPDGHSCTFCPGHDCCKGLSSRTGARFVFSRASFLNKSASISTWGTCSCVVS